MVFVVIEVTRRSSVPQDVASQTLESLQKETRIGLEYALQTHKTIDVQMDLNAPIIIVPEEYGGLGNRARTLTNWLYAVLPLRSASTLSSMRVTYRLSASSRARKPFGRFIRSATSSILRPIMSTSSQ